MDDFLVFQLAILTLFTGILLIVVPSVARSLARKVQRRLKVLLEKSDPPEATIEGLKQELDRLGKSVLDVQLILAAIFGIVVVRLAWLGMGNWISFMVDIVVLMMVIIFQQGVTKHKIRREVVYAFIEHLLGESAPPQVQIGLEAVWRMNDDRFRPAVMDAHAAWGSPGSLLWFKEQMSNDPPLKQKMNAAGTMNYLRMYQARQTDLKAFTPHNLTTLEPLLAASQYWRRVLEASQGKSRQQLGELLNLGAGAPASLRDFFTKYQPTIAGHPDLFCEKCRRRPRWTNEYEPKVLQCPQCRTIDHLLDNVKTVVGRIGTHTQQVQTGKTLLLDLWDTSNKKPRPAEIERLEVFPNAEIDMDWALAAVTNSLNNFFSDEPPSIKIVLPGSISIEKNTQGILTGFYAEPFLRIPPPIL